MTCLETEFIGWHIVDGTESSIWSFQPQLTEFCGCQFGKIVLIIGAAGFSRTRSGKTSIRTWISLFRAVIVKHHFAVFVDCFRKKFDSVLTVSVQILIVVVLGFPGWGKFGGFTVVASLHWVTGSVIVTLKMIQFVINFSVFNQIQVGFRSDSSQILVGFWSDSGRILVEFWSDSGQILVGFRSDSGRIQDGFGLDSGRIQVGFWSDSGWIQVEFELN